MLKRNDSESCGFETSLNCPAKMGAAVKLENK